MATKRAGGKKTALVKTASTSVLTGYDELLRDLKRRIEQAQVRAAVAVNRELVLLYWNIGRDILIRQQQQGWGAKVIDRLAADLRREFPEMKGIWFYELPLPEGRKNYTKTAPLQYEEFVDCLSWWNNREENEQAWKIKFAEIYRDARTRATPHWEKALAADARVKELAREYRSLSDEIQTLQKPLLAATQNGAGKKGTSNRLAELERKRGEVQRAEIEQRELAKEEQAKGDAIYWVIYNLDIKNPRGKQDFEHMPPAQLADDILNKELRIAEIVAEIKQVLAGATA